MNGRGSSAGDIGAPAIVSVSLHVVVLALAIFGLPSFSKPRDEQPPEVEIIDASEIGKHSAAPKVAPPTPQDKSLPEKPEPTPPPPMKSPEPAAAPPPPEPPKPQVADQLPPPPPPPPPPVIPKVETPKPPEPPKQPDPHKVADAEPLKPKPQPEPPKPEPKPPEPPPPQPKPPEPPKPKPPEPPKPPPAPPKPPPPAPKPKAQSLDDILADATKTPAPPTPNVDRRNAPVGKSDPNSKPTQQAARGPQTASVNSPKLTQSEEWAVIQKIRPCWNPPLGAKDADKLAIEIMGSIGRDGRVIEARIVDESRMRDSFYAAAANAALRATLNPRCQPWPLPPEKYETWKTFRFTFDPRFF